MGLSASFTNQRFWGCAIAASSSGHRRTPFRCDPESVDVVTTRSVLIHLLDKSPAVRELHRVRVEAAGYRSSSRSVRLVERFQRREVAPVW
jgi:hypothetical protein